MQGTILKDYFSYMVQISCGERLFLLSTWETRLKTTSVNKVCGMCSYKLSSQFAAIHRSCKSSAPPNKTSARRNSRHFLPPSQQVLTNHSTIATRSQLPQRHNCHKVTIATRSQLPQGHKGPCHDIDQPATNSVILASSGFCSDCL